MAWENFRADKHVRLDHISTKETNGLKKEEAQKRPRLKEAQQLVRDLQRVLYASAKAAKRSVLVVLQGMDTSGKDAVIRKAFDKVNPVGLRVHSFKAPSAEELSHDFLWRLHQKTPAAGEIVVFNRSHYEDVVAVRVKKLVPDDIWKRRYALINEFEQLLVREGTLVIKLFLHISKEEQRKRLQERVTDPFKQWKFNPRDLDDRARWGEYMAVWQDAINKCSAVPWHVIPSDHEWFRNIAAAEIIAAEMAGMGLEYPEPDFDTNLVVG